MYATRLIGCEGDGNDDVGSGGNMVAVSGYMGGTRGSGVLSSAYNVLEMSVVRGVGGVCGMYLDRGGVGGVGGEWVTGLGLGFTDSGGTWGKWDMCLCFGCGDQFLGICHHIAYTCNHLLCDTRLLVDVVDTTPVTSVKGVGYQFLSYWVDGFPLPFRQQLPHPSTRFPP